MGGYKWRDMIQWMIGRIGMKGYEWSYMVGSIWHRESPALGVRYEFEALKRGNAGSAGLMSCLGMEDDSS